MCTAENHRINSRSQNVFKSFSDDRFGNNAVNHGFFNHRYKKRTALLINTDIGIQGFDGRNI